MESSEHLALEQARERFENELQRYLQAVRTDRSGVAAPAQPLSEGLNELSDWLRARFNEFMTLLEISSELNKVMLLDDILARIYTFFQEVIPFDRIGCALIDEKRENVTAYWVKFTYNENPRIDTGYSAPIKGSSLETIINTGKPRILNDLELYLAEHPESESTRRIVAEGIRSSLTCPLIAEGKPVGFLFFSSREKNTYQHLHQEIFLYLAGQVAQIIEKSRLYQKIIDLNKNLQDAYQQLQERASRDSLTGVLNRGAILEHFSQQLQHARTNQLNLAVIMLDIDHFKRLNDTYGHVNGDIVLRNVASILREGTPAPGRCGRYGGEEFLLVLSEEVAERASEVAEKIRKTLAESFVNLDGTPVQVTASLGVALLREQPQASTTELIELADSRLYLAKQNGRNQVCSA